MNLTNYHSHCSFCDGKAPMEDFVKSAIAAGFTSYGISSHAPLPFETCWTLSQERVPDYLQEIGRLKQRYAGEIEIYAGLEIDYLNEIQNPANSYFQALPLDYRIGSVHLVYTDEEEIIDTDTDPERGIMMEINTKAFLRKGCFFPDIRHFAFIRALGIPVLVNSDAHRPDLINAGRAEALQALKEAGFHTVRQLQGGKWIDVPIA